MNAGKHIKIERAILGTLFVVYFWGIVYALFFMFPLNFGTDGAIRHAANFALGSAVYASYTAGGVGLIGSQFMWNIILFLPLGFLPLLFRRVQLHWWHAAVAGLFISILCEAVQFFIGRSADVDDVAANTLGTVIGYICLALGNRIARPRPDRDHLSWPRMLPWYALSLRFWKACRKKRRRWLAIDGSPWIKQKNAGDWRWRWAFTEKCGKTRHSAHWRAWTEA